MSYDKMVTILAAMGVVIRKPKEDTETEAHEKLVKSRLYYKITEFKDEKVDGIRNIDTFTRLSKDTSKKVEIDAMVNIALSEGVIRKSKKNQYYFGTIQMGTSKEKVRKFLQDSDNFEVFEQIVKKVKK